MSKYDMFRFLFQNSSAEERLASLRGESLTNLHVINGYATILQKNFQESTTEAADLKKIIDASNELLDLIFAITELSHREMLEKGIEPEWWKRGMLELKPFDSLGDAIRFTAQKLNLSLAIAIDDTSKIFIHSENPLVLLDEPKYHRQITFSLLELGYSVELLSFVEQRSFQVEYQISLSTLDDVAIVINKWLLEQRAVSEIQKEYPLPNNGG